MSREMMLGMLRAGNNGEQILQILDTIVGDDYDADFEESQPTMEEIAFWCDSLTSGTQGVVILMTPCHTNNVNEVLMETAFVTPKSKKAKNRFANMLQNDSECIVEQHKGDRVFLASMNQKYFFWVNLNNDPDWIVEF